MEWSLSDPGLDDKWFLLSYYNPYRIDYIFNRAMLSRGTEAPSWPALPGPEGRHS